MLASANLLETSFCSPAPIYKKRSFARQRQSTGTGAFAHQRQSTENGLLLASANLQDNQRLLASANLQETAFCSPAPICRKWAFARQRQRRSTGNGRCAPAPIRKRPFVDLLFASANLQETVFCSPAPIYGNWALLTSAYLQKTAFCSPAPIYRKRPSARQRQSTGNGRCSPAPAQIYRKWAALASANLLETAFCSPAPIYKKQSFYSPAPIYGTGRLPTNANLQKTPIYRE